MTTTQRDAISPIPEGLVIYNTDNHTLEAHISGFWYSIMKESCAPSRPGNISGNTIACENQTGVLYSIAAGDD